MLALLAAATFVCSPSFKLELPKVAVEPFPLTQVHLSGGEFKIANQKCANYLLTVDPNRLLHSFLINSGLPADAPIYGGWESSGLAGHSLGHYLTACSQEYANSGDQRFKGKVDQIVVELVRCQKNRPDGYISAIPGGDKVWAEIKRGEIKSHGFDLNGLWSPWYTHHKVLAGLLDAYHLVGNKEALEVARRFADWAIEETSTLTDEQWQKMLVCEYGGMNEVLADLSAITKEPKYLSLARRFYDHRVLDSLSQGADDLPGKHSNTQIPKIIGLSRLYELTGDQGSRRTAEFFWHTVVEHHSYVIGGNSNHEYFGSPDQLSEALSTNTCETCNTYNMLKLTRHLFEWNPQVQYADYYERAHLNDILASQNPETGMMCYFVPLSSGAFREYSDPFDTWTCCHGTGMENHTKHVDSVYFHSGNQALYVSQFIPTILDWTEAGFKLEQQTSYPENGRVTLTIDKAPDHPITLFLRHPGWADGSLQIKINAQAWKLEDHPGQFVALNRSWHSGDKVEFEIPFTLRTEPMPDNPKRVAILYGPTVLAASLGSPSSEVPRAPVLITGGAPPENWLHASSSNPLEFNTTTVSRPQETLNFKPFYRQFDSRYAVYFDQFTPEQWSVVEEDYRKEEERQQDLVARTVDYSRIGEMQPERDHHLTSEGNDVRDANGRSFRTPLNGGWFEITLKVEPTQACQLVTTYFGNDRLKPRFDLLGDGKLLVTETLPHFKSNLYFDEVTTIPLELTKGKASIVVRVQAYEGRPAGSIAGMRIVRAK